MTSEYSEIRMKSAVLTGTCELREVKSGSISNFETDVEISSLLLHPNRQSQEFSVSPRFFEYLTKCVIVSSEE